MKTATKNKFTKVSKITDKGVFLPQISSTDGYANELIKEINCTRRGDVVGLVSMQLQIKPDTDKAKTNRLIDAILSAHYRGVKTIVRLDKKYINRMVRVGNRDMPRLVVSKKQKLHSNYTQEILVKLHEAGILQDGTPEKSGRGYIPWIRYIGSMHPLQRLSVMHTKGAFIVKGGTVSAWIMNANLTDSDLNALSPDLVSIGMNNLVIKLSGGPACIAMLAMQHKIPQNSGRYCFSEKNIQILHDTSDTGEPSRFPIIFEEALRAIDPSRRERIESVNDLNVSMADTVVLISQYLPDGIMFNCLDDTAKSGSSVFVAGQTPKDYRRAKWPHSTHYKYMNRRLKSAQVKLYDRSVPSHSKCLIVRYTDSRVKIIIGSDNLAAHLQKFVCNEEMAAVINIDMRDDLQRKYFEDLVSLLKNMHEINSEIEQQLLRPADTDR